MTAKPGQCSIELISDMAQFKNLQKDWNRLVCEGAYDITNSWEWLFSWWEIYKDSRELYILVFTINNSIVAIFPFQRITEKKYCLQRKIIRFLGTGENELDETCSEYIDLIIAHHARDAVVKRFIAYLQDNSSEWHSIILKDVRKTSLNISALVEKNTDVNIEYQDDSIKAPYIDLPDTWEELLSISRINAREQINRKYKLLSEQGKLVFKKFSGDEITESVFGIFMELHQKRWENTDKPGCFSSSLFTEFHKKLLIRYADKKQLILYFLYLDNKAIAARYCLEYNNIVYDYQSGLDTDYQTRSSPGTVLLAHVIKDSIERGTKRYDFFKGKKGSYKYKWTRLDQVLVTLWIKNKTVLNVVFDVQDFVVNVPRYVRSLFS